MTTTAYTVSNMPYIPGLPDPSVIDQEGFLNLGEFGGVLLAMLLAIFVLVGAIIYMHWATNRTWSKTVSAVARENNATMRDITNRHDEREKESNTILRGFFEVMTAVQLKIDNITSYHEANRRKGDAG